MATVFVPTIVPHQFGGLFISSSIIASEHRSLIVDFSRCASMSYNGISVLTGALKDAIRRRVIVDILWTTVNPALMLDLQAHGFSRSFGYKGGTAPSHVVPLREFLPSENVWRQVVTHLKEEWLKPDRLAMGVLLRSQILGRIAEIYQNAFEHARSHAGVFSCGSHDEGSGNLALCICDVGVSIPGNVKAFLGAPAMSEIDALQWAFTHKNTTKPDSYSRGLGLEMVSKFIQANKGALRTYSGGAGYVIREDGVKFEPLLIPFKGTIIDISLNCDDPSSSSTPPRSTVSFGISRS